MIGIMIGILFKLLIGHAFADYAFQSAYMAEKKSPLMSDEWYYHLLAHSLIHAGMVWLITGSPVLAFAELILHFLIDRSKSMGDITRNVDQTLHFFCKFVYTLILGMAIW